MAKKDRHQDIAAFHASFGGEVLARRDRVRHLIGGVHWLSDGSYKEQLVRDAVRTAIPSKYRVGHGFILRTAEQPGPERLKASPQLDVLVYRDSERAPELLDGDFACVLSATAVAVGEVKSTLSVDEAKGAARHIGKTVAMYRGEQIYDDERAFTSMIVGMRSECHDDGAGKLGPNGQRAFARAFREAFAEVYPSGLEDACFMKNAGPCHVGIPSVMCSLDGVPWVALGTTYATPHPEHPGDSTRLVRIPVVQFFDPCVNVDGTVRNLALHMTLSLLRYNLDPIDIVNGRLTERSRQVNRQDWGYYYAPLGKPIALLPGTPRLLQAFQDQVEWLDDSS